MAQSYAVEVIADSSNTWAGNGMRYETYEIAEAAAIDLMSRWFAGRDWRVIESSDPINDNGHKPARRVTI